MSTPTEPTPPTTPEEPTDEQLSQIITAVHDLITLGQDAGLGHLSHDRLVERLEGLFERKRSAS